MPVTAQEFEANPPTQTVPVAAIPADAMMLDVGPATVAALVARLPSLRTLVWNGPLGAFETPPFDAATVALAQAVAEATGRRRCAAWPAAATPSPRCGMRASRTG